MESKFLGLRKGAWTKEEDNLLRKCIEKYGEGKWHQVPLRAGLNRCRKSCRLRWLNYLRPNIKRGYFAKDEVDLMARLHKLLGNKWSLIAGRLPGRTANGVKNFWNTHAEKMLSFEQVIKINDKNHNYDNKKNNVERTKTFTPNHIIKPRPRIFTKVLNENRPMEIARNKDEISDKMQNQVSEYFSQEKVDDCIEWWSKLLEQTENSETIMAPLVDMQAGETSSSGLGDHEGRFFSIEELDVWELLNHIDK